MEHKTIQFEVVQATNPCCWKWIVFLDATRMRTGIALTRADAALDAELASKKRWSSSGSAEASPIRARRRSAAQNFQCLAFPVRNTS
jgi:hypothetical protein